MLTRKASSAILLGTLGCLRLLAADTLETKAWDILHQAIQARGEAAGTALELMGEIDDPTSRALIDATFKSGNTAAIEYIAAGLTPTQSVSYLSDLGKAAYDPDAGTVLSILGAIARAGTAEAARILIDVGDRAGQPTAGVAFGLLAERMGPLAEPLLIGMVSNGRSARTRQTAVEILRRKRVPNALVAFRSALHDPDRMVRTAGAFGLLQLGYQDGRQEIEAVAGDSRSDYRIEALVALATLGRPEAFDQLRALVTSPDEAVRGRTVWAIARSGNAGLKEFSYRMGLDRQPAFRSMIAEKLLDPSDPSDLRALQEMMARGDEMSQVIAAERLLGTSLSDRAVTSVARALASGNESVRSVAVRIVSRNPVLRPELAKQLASPDPNVQVAAMSAIMDLNQQDRFKDVAPYLGSENRAVSLAAARTLVKLDPAAAKSVFVEGLKANASHVRIHSAAMLLAMAARGRPK